MAIENITGKRVPPGAALVQQVAAVRPLLPMSARLVVGPLLDTFAAYVASMEERVADLEKRGGAANG